VSGGLPGAMSTPEVVTFAPSASLVPFVATKNTTTTSKSIDLDRCMVSVMDVLR
jgi:hypothetical protein